MPGFSTGDAAFEGADGRTCSDVLPRPVWLANPNGIIEMATWQSFPTVQGGAGWAWVTPDNRTIGFYDPVGWRAAAIAYS